MKRIVQLELDVMKTPTWLESCVGVSLWFISVSVFFESANYLFVRGQPHCLNVINGENNNGIKIRRSSGT